MRIIRPMENELLMEWNKQCYFRHISYRPIYYLLDVPVEEGVVLLNTMTSEIVLITNDEYNDFKSGKLRESNEMLYRFFVVHWFAIPETYDEYTMWSIVRQKRTPNVYISDKLNTFTIFTTTDCNARCYYCYQIQDTTRMTMSEQTASDVADFIIDHCDRNNTIWLRWFGGEPLFNAKAIDIICSKIKESGLKYNSSITSNGYLFDEETVKKAVDLWRLCTAQITLDGTEEVYNKTKSFIYKDGVNPFHRVLDAIELLDNNRITVNIRINLSKDNIDDAHNLVDVVHDRFPNHHKIAIYTAPIFEDEGPCTHTWTEEEREYVFSKKFELEDYIIEKGLRGRSETIRQKKLSNVHCMADTPGSITIMPHGKLGKCEHDIENESDGYYGSIYDDNPINHNYRAAQMYRIPAPEYTACKTCPRFPRCIRREKCQSAALCHDQLQESKTREDKFLIYNTYLKFKEEYPDIIESFMENNYN